MPFTIATWNINSVRLRTPIVEKLLQEEAPDILCLQECKSPVEKIPLESFAALGYGHMVAGVRKAITGWPSCRNCRLKMRATKILPGWAMHATWRRGWKTGL